MFQTSFHLWRFFCVRGELALPLSEEAFPKVGH